MDTNFWNNLKRPIIGLAPMDGVTDVAFRQMVVRHSKPDVLITEFVNVEGLARGAVKMLHAFRYEENERPIVAQVFGVEVESFYKATVMLLNMGFDGVDINMGCPVNKVARKGSGAGLIQTPEKAKEIIRACKRAAKDFAEGISMEEAGVHEAIIAEVNRMYPKGFERRLLPISVKTRIGYDKPVTEEWIKCLIEEDPANITLHGRTLKQLYLGEANWKEIAKGGKLCKEAGISFLGNGDVKNYKDAQKKCKKYKIDGVLVGRATFGDPWFFSDYVPTFDDRVEAALEHVGLFEKLLGDKLFFAHMKKHLGWYLKGFDGAKELRVNLMAAETFDQAREIITVFRNSLDN